VVDFWIVVLLLTARSGEKYLGNALSSKCGHKFTEIIERTVVENALNKQGITDVLFLCLRRVPKEVLVLNYDLFA